MEKLLNEIEELTYTDYQITAEEFEKIDGRVINMIEDLLAYYQAKDEELEKFEREVEEYYIFRGYSEKYL